MEKTPPKSCISIRDEVKNFLVDNRDEEPGCSTTSDETKSSSNTSRETKRKNAQSSDATSPPPANRSSPDPCCAICLETLQNKSFTNSCLHMFCFKCLVEWSKIKPECPLCKQQFKSIIHNVQEDFQYDTYYIKNRSTESYWNFPHSLSGSVSSVTLNASSSEPRFRYRTTLTSDRLIRRSSPSHADHALLHDRLIRNHTSHSDHAALHASLQMQIENHRMRFAPHSVSVISTSQTADRRPSIFRSQVYQHNLWVKSRPNDRVRLASPEFFRLNPACTHRLLPWLNRELIVLLDNIESQIVFVLELIMALITRYEIMSQEFFMHIEPYLLERTNHFLHEFYNFASSPYEMNTYDGHAVYEPLQQVVDPVLPSLPNNDFIDIDNEEAFSSGTTTSRMDYSNHEGEAHNQQSTRHIEKMVLKRNRETDSWVTVMGPLPLMHDYSNMTNFYNPGPSTSSGAGPSRISIFDAPSMSMISPLRIESSDDECEIVEVVKPKSERTPVIVDLSSDEETPAIVDISSAEDNNSNEDDIDYIYNSSPASCRFDTPVRRNYSSSDVECVYESKSTVSEPKEQNVIPDTSSPERNSPIDLSERNSNLISSIIRTSAFQEFLKTDSAPIDLSDRNLTPIDLSEKKSHANTSFTKETVDAKTAVKPSVPSKIVVPNSSTAQSSHSFLSVSPNITKCTSTSHFTDISSPESCPDADPSQTSKRKKLKLRSVVAHFSFDNSDERQESGHRSSYKKHKDKKKKKKHSRKRKRSNYTNSESSS